MSECFQTLQLSRLYWVPQQLPIITKVNKDVDYNECIKKFFLFYLFILLLLFSSADSPGEDDDPPPLKLGPFGSFPHSPTQTTLSSPNLLSGESISFPVSLNSLVLLF